MSRGTTNVLTACRTLANAQALADGLPSTTAISLDVNSASALDAQVAAHDLVISLIPYTYHAAVIKAAVKGHTNVVTTSYISPAMRELEEEVKKAGIVVLNEIGLDPGIDHLYAVKTIGEVHAKGGKVHYIFLWQFVYVTECVPFRSSNSTPTVVASPLPNVPTTPLDTNSPGRLVVSFSLS